MDKTFEVKMSRNEGICVFRVTMGTLGTLTRVRPWEVRLGLGRWRNSSFFLQVHEFSVTLDYTNM